MGQTRRILLIYQGGTIGMVSQSPEGGLVPAEWEDLRPYLADIDNLSCEFSFWSLHPAKDSSNLGPADWEELARVLAAAYHKFDAFVVLHGTDTMAYTASALSFMLENLGKPVILTGSVLPLNELRSDGRENIITALEVAADAAISLPEVVIAFDAHLYRGNRSINRPISQSRWSSYFARTTQSKRLGRSH